MPVDKFGRTDVINTTRVISGGITLSQASNVFLRRDGGNAAAADINLDSHKLINIADPTNNKDAANKEYVDANSGTDKVSKSGDTMTGNLLLGIGTDSIRQLGCTDLTSGKGFSLALGNVRNQFQFAIIPTGQTQTPVTLETTHGFLVRSANQNVCLLGNAIDPSINIYKNVIMNRSTTIKNLIDPTDPEDAATKNYVDTLMSLNYGHIPPLGENNSKTGFVVTASSFLSQQHAPYMAFNPLLTGDINVEWVTAGEGAGAWLQIECPAAVRIWKIRLAGRRNNAERITSWNLAGSNGGGTHTTVLTSTTTLGSTVQDFIVNIPAGTSYGIYSLNVVTAEPTNTGLSVFQIFPSMN